jgi:hypothetical protein
VLSLQCLLKLDLALKELTLHELGVSSATTGTSIQTPEPVMAFADVEGQVSSTTPLLLVPTVCLYYWKGLPNRTTMLNQLAVLDNAAQHMQFR